MCGQQPSCYPIGYQLNSRINCPRSSPCLPCRMKSIKENEGQYPINKLPAKLTSIASPVRKALRAQFHTLLYRARQRKGLRVFALGQRLRHFADHVTHSAGAANGKRVRHWFQEKKAGWYAVLADP